MNALLILINEIITLYLYTLFVYVVMGLLIQFQMINNYNKIKEFIFQISNTEKIYLSRKDVNKKFNQEIITLKLDKKIIYKENIILQSLYKAATDQNIPPNTIIEFARIYGFQIDFQRDIRKKDKFQIMYEIFIDENNKIIENIK